LLVHARKGIGLLKQRMRRLVRRREQDDAAGVTCHLLDRGSDGGGRRGPDKKHSFDPAQGGDERFGRGEVAPGHFDVRRKMGGFGIANQRAHLEMAGKLGRDLASDTAGSADDKDAVHWVIIGGVARDVVAGM
jgi:hypothetical protein